MDETLAKLKIQLEKQDWPNVYLFKFIVPNVPKSIAQVSNLFEETATLKFQESKNGKYMSVSAKELMLDVDSVLAIYEKASLIENILSL